MKVYQVGGSVRDKILGVKPHDIDYCVVGSTVDEMLSLGYKQVGKEFPVFLHPITGDEYALARTERKNGNKHTDFIFDFNPNITIEEDLKRRNTTCNAIAIDIDTGEYIDPYGGIDDIKRKILRAVCPSTFIEDPLRVLILCQQAARFGFNIDILTLQLCRDMVKDGMLENLSPERIWKEIEKALNCDNFDVFIRAMQMTGALKVILPEVDKLFKTPENELYHPEGNSGEHTLLAIKQAKLPITRFAMLLHDVGKGSTPSDILPHHYGHDVRGLSIIKDICQRLRVPNEYRDFALLVCKEHMRIRNIKKDIKFYNLVEEMTKFKDNTQLVNFLDCCRCDSSGRKGGISFDYDEKLQFFTNKCMKMFNILKDVKADMFPELSKYSGKEFGDKLKAKKFQYYIDTEKKNDI